MEEKELTDSLRALQPAWEQARKENAAKPTDSKPTAIPDGTYKAIIESAILRRARNTQNPVIEWQLLINEGEQRGRKEYYIQAITSNTVNFVMENLKKCGIDCDEIEKIAAYLPQARGVELEIVIKTKGERRNVYFNRQIMDERSLSGDVLGHDEIESITVGADLPVD